MTNHVNELMKAAGVETKTESYCKWECKKPALETSPICHDADCLFRKIRTFYPAFTPAKQLELVKLIGDFNCFQDEISNWVMTHHDINRVRSYRVEGNKDFSDTLANFILYLIVKKQLDKSEVKRILEDD